MATTPKGIYFPEGSTNADFVSILSTLASSVDSALGDTTYDSGWISVTPDDMVGGWEPFNNSGSRVRYRKVGKTVHLDGIIRNGTTSALFTLPSGFRPVSVHPNFICPIINTATPSIVSRVRVDPSGLITAYGTSQATRDDGIGLSSIIFLTD